MPGLIETRALTKQYPGVRALDALDLQLEPGIIGLVGANGAGKSTLLKILLGLIDATSGSASMLGFDVVTEGPTARQFVGYMPEHDCLPIDISATEFVAHMAQINGLPRGAARERTAETLRHVGLFEERYREMRGYSTGMKQRVKLAQALVHDPRLMLLDEPTNGLDPEGRDEMLDLVRRTGKEFGISIIMASHLLSEIERVCEHLVVIDAGKLVQSDSIASFTRQTAVLLVEVDGDAAPVGERIRGAGFSVTVDRRELRVPITDDRVYDLIRDATIEAGVGLVRLEQDRRQLEDLFRESQPEEAAGV
ncbi:MAG: ABC transporter ATP-binding protein [Dehalococcoidia bacterium]|nr:ABC transporter ATP-binding protein [Dehalococcoidia bacterium]MCA9843064.1 ABC transporter ATP-binding protein [Dehalococcoidia bacterium]